MAKITKKSNLYEVLESNQKAAEILFKHGMHCLGCMATQFETLEDGCKAHGLSDKDINKIISELNKKA